MSTTSVAPSTTSMASPISRVGDRPRRPDRRTGPARHRDPGSSAVVAASARKSAAYSMPWSSRTGWPRRRARGRRVRRTGGPGCSTKSVTGSTTTSPTSRTWSSTVEQTRRSRRRSGRRSTCRSHRVPSSRAVSSTTSSIYVVADAEPRRGGRSSPVEYGLSGSSPTARRTRRSRCAVAGPADSGSQSLRSALARPSLLGGVAVELGGGVTDVLRGRGDPGSMAPFQFDPNPRGDTTDPGDRPQRRGDRPGVAVEFVGRGPERAGDPFQFVGVGAEHGRGHGFLGSQERRDACSWRSA